MKTMSVLSALALSAGLCGASFGQITGTVMLKGKPPEMKQIDAVKTVPACAMLHKDPVFEETVVTGDKGELANVVVSIKTPEGKDLGTAPTTPAVLDQKGCMYRPHVVAVMVDQPLEVQNSDPFLHNVHTLSFDNAAVNVGMVNAGKKVLEPFKAVETFKVKCDVHPWMSAWIRVLDNPYFAVTSADEKSIGTYSIDTKGLPDGEYSFIAWHEKYGTSPEQKVKVTGGKAQVNFTFDAAKKPSAQATPVKEIHLASANAIADCPACAAQATKVAVAK
ncbi:MAG TPA: hypothetical protein VFC78_14800 [Tepidisphaeraceae bacterium]|nr:hypothetical protein [Tepidisphaeraceae bacterium]